MESIYKPNRKEITKQVQKVIKSLKVDSSTDDKAKGALGLSILTFLATDNTEMPLAQQLLKLLKYLDR